MSSKKKKNYVVPRLCYSWQRTAGSGDTGKGEEEEKVEILFSSWCECVFESEVTLLRTNDGASLFHVRAMTLGMKKILTDL